VCQELTGATKVREELRQYLFDAMGCVAIATVCDVVPLIDENRVLAHFGLRSLEDSKVPGIVALLEVAGLKGRRLLAEDVAFKVGPRINASGRLGSAQKAVELLLARDAESARVLAMELDALNDERRRIEKALLGEVIAAAEVFADRELHPVLVVAGQGWHQGVLGILASRLVSRFERPAIVIGLDGERGRGSARSVPGFNVLDVMNGAATHLVKHGGHEQAAGCDVEAAQVDALREAVCACARQKLGDGDHPAREVRIDHAVPFAQITVELMKEIERLQPFGERNEKPMLMSSDLRLAEPPRVLGGDGTHLMLRVRSGDHVLKAMAFGQARRASELSMGMAFDAVFTPKWNVFRGETNLELELHDFRARATTAG
jgi:single-stranded-DNA-specific exonuclease